MKQRENAPNTKIPTTKCGQQEVPVTVQSSASHVAGPHENLGSTIYLRAHSRFPLMSG